MHLLKILKIVVGAAFAVVICFNEVSATDWPMWRFNSDRSAISPEQLPDSLYLQWTCDYNPPRTAWDNQSQQYAYGSTSDGVTPIKGKLNYVRKALSFDIAYQPVVAGTTMMFGSPNNDRFTAIDITTGSEKWHFFAGGPIRFAPVAKKGKVYFGSDDGYLYCLNIADGSLVWKFNGTPNSRKVLGNDRLISVWPVRGGPVIPSPNEIVPTRAYTKWSNSHDNKYRINSVIDEIEESAVSGKKNTGTSSLNLNYSKTADTGESLVAIRFSHDSYRIKQGAVIDSAFIQFASGDTVGASEPCTISIFAVTADSSVAFSTDAHAVSLLPRTTRSVEWTVPSWSGKSAGQKAKQRTPDLAPVLKELVNRAGWKAASPITFIFAHKSGSGIRNIIAGDKNLKTAPYVSVFSSGLIVDSTTAPVKTEIQTNPDSSTIYFAAGLYPFEGVFVYALDINDGSIKWLNDRNYMQYMETPHSGSESYSGLAPQGYFCTAVNNKLLIPNGRTYPACLDRASGDMDFLDASGGNGYHVVSQWDQIYVGDKAFKLPDFSSVGESPEFFDGNSIQIKAGSKLYTSGTLDDTLPGAPVDTSIYTVSCGSWKQTFSGKPAGLLAANGYLFVTTTNGKIYCFGSKRVSNPPVLKNQVSSFREDSSIQIADDIIKQSGYKTGNRGICIAIGLVDGSLVEALARNYDLTVIGIDPDTVKVNRIRERLDSTGLYGYNIHLITGDIRTAGIPQYIAQLIVTENPSSGFAELTGKTDDFIEAVFHSLRPYGGTACLPVKQSIIQTSVSKRKLQKAEVLTSGIYTLLRRAGALPGSADFTSQYCDAAHSNCVEDSLAKAPLGLLWFGGSSDNTNDKVNSRHGHGPTEQVSGGHYYIQGPDMLRCVDIYTGRVLWEKEIKNFGQFSYYTEHEAGQSALGDNYVSFPDAIYALDGYKMNQFPQKCLVIDPNTGKTNKTFTLPDSLGAWGLLSVSDSFIVATTQPMVMDSAKLGNGFVYWYKDKSKDSISMVGVGGTNTYNGTYSNGIVVLNRFTGKLLWNRKAQYGFYNLTVVSGNGKVFAIDNLPSSWSDMMKRAGKLDSTSTVPKVKAFNIRTGALLWVDSSNNVFGRYLAYSVGRDILIEASRKNDDYIQNEPAANRMVARKGSDGKTLWHWADTSISYYGGPVILDDTSIITQDVKNFGLVSLNTGKIRKVNYGLMDKESEFYFTHHHGCNYGLGALNMITFRSGSQSYYDLTKMDGVTNIAGSKSGCTPSVVPADGIVTSAEYTRTCHCMYPIVTSNAMVYNPDVERWTCNEGLAKRFLKQGGKLTNIGINLGAPGDRKDDDGTFWVEYPNGETSTSAKFSAYPLPINVKVTGDSVTWFRHHSSRVKADGLNWVASSGVENASKISLAMVIDSLDNSGKAAPHVTTNDKYDVTLYFMEPDLQTKPGDRKFGVSINGVTVEGNLDIAKVAGGPMKPLVKTVKNVTIGDSLQIAFTTKVGKPVLSGVKAIKVKR